MKLAEAPPPLIKFLDIETKMGSYYEIKEHIPDVNECKRHYGILVCFQNKMFTNILTSRSCSSICEMYQEIPYYKSEARKKTLICRGEQ